MPVLSWEQVAAVAIKGGFPPGPAVIATAITMPEAGRDSTVVQAGQPYATTGWGLWQITPGNSVPQYGIDNALLYPLNNARAAHAKWSDAGGFSPWTTYENGLEQPYIGDAEAAVRAVTHMSAAELARLVKSAAKGGGIGVAGAAGFNDWSPQVRKSRDHVHTSAKRFTDYGHAIGGIRPHLRAPAIHNPTPGELLWHLARSKPDD
jgi:Lysozyme like domain